jgi:GT2 family glycosyltransferase
VDQVIPVLAIPILNRYDLLDQNLKTIDYPIGEILIINNNKDTNYVPPVTDLNVRVLNLPSNLGMSGSWNLTIKLYPHEKYWMFSSADTHWIPGSLEQLHNESGKEKLVMTTEGWSAFSIGEDMIRNVGLFDEYFYPIYYEDNDYYERVMRSNMKDGYVNGNIKVNAPHGASQTINSDQKLMNRNHETFVKNGDYFNKKKSEDFKVTGVWDIDRRRDQEWLR